MTTAIDTTRIDRLRELHGLIMGSAVKTIRAAIEAGGILVEVKGGLPHGEFTSWCEKNLPFDVRTAQRYMRCYMLRGRLLKNDSMSHLTGAYRLLEESREGSQYDFPRMIKELRECLMDSEMAVKLMKKAIGEDKPHMIDPVSERIHDFLSILKGPFMDLLARAGPEDIESLSQVTKILQKIQALAAERTLWCDYQFGKKLNELEARWPEMYQVFVSNDEKRKAELITGLEAKIARLEGSAR
jgi:hypothetical protein